MSGGEAGRSGEVRRCGRSGEERRCGRSGEGRERPRGTGSLNRNRTQTQTRCTWWRAEVVRGSMTPSWSRPGADVRCGVV